MDRNARVFYTLVLTQTFSLIGSRISGLAIGMYIYNQTGNATPLTLVAFFATIPMVLASSLSGVLADRWDRRLVMVLADAGQAVGTLLLLLIFMSGTFELWHLYLITLIQSTFGVFQGPAFQASITMLIPDDQRDRANAIMQLVGPMSGIVAPAIAGFVYAALGVNGAIFLDLLTFLVAMGVIFSLHIPRPEQTEEGKAMAGSVWQESWSGLRYLLKHRVMMAIVVYVAFLNFLVSGAMTLSTPYILARTSSEATLGIIMSIMNSGAIIGGLILGVWGGTRPRMNTIMPGIIISSFMLIGLGSGQSPVALAAFGFLFMLPLPMVNGLFMSIMQIKIAPDIQGRVFAVIGQLTMILTPIAYLIVGPLADQVFEPAVNSASWGAVAPLVGDTVGSGMGMIILLGGALSVLISVAMFSIPAIRKMESSLPDYLLVTVPAPVEPLAEEAGKAVSM